MDNIFKRYQNRRFLWTILLFLVCTHTPLKAEVSNDNINLALRRTADALLRLCGDTVSQIPAVKQIGTNKWQVQINQSIDYEHLPSILQSSLDQYHILGEYQVAIRNCVDGTIDLGYHYQDLHLKGTIPCGGRERSISCNYIEITFINPEVTMTFSLGFGLVSLLFMGGMVGLWYLRRKNPNKSISDNVNSQLLDFGASSLDVSGQKLYCKGKEKSLTFREAKLLHLFVNHANRLLERDFIMQEVWVDEGILVGRSVDVFVSRLRKKISDDPSVSLVAVHGVGYRLEIA